MATVAPNINRLNHLLSLFRLSSDELLSLLSIGLANKVSQKDVFSEEIKLSTLKKIDKVFNKGLSYYVDPSPVKELRGESIFFRKDTFNASLSLRDKQIVNQYEEKKIIFESILKLSDIQKQRVLPKFSIEDNPTIVASEIRKYVYPSQIPRTKDFLRALITNLANNNILVFEHVESPRRNEKANINGFYLSPNVIVLKWQKYTKRELFTLVHELGHYLLDEEEIDENVNIEISDLSLNSIENWCNEFAFNFLIGGFNIDSLPYASSENDFHHSLIEKISEQTHLSTLALYTRLRKINKISIQSYTAIEDSVKEYIRKEAEDEKRQNELNKIKAEEEGRKLIIPPVKAIVSPLYINSLQVALSAGVLNEYEFCTSLNINPDKIDSYLV